jgi:hypothetical protein
VSFVDTTSTSTIHGASFRPRLSCEHLSRRFHVVAPAFFRYAF